MSPSAGAPVPERTRPHEAPRVLLVFVASVALLAAASRSPPLHADTARDLLLARDCVDVGRCALEGPRSSFARILQGASWSHLLEMSRAAGLGLFEVRAVLIALHAAAATLVAFAPRRLCAWPVGPLAWGFFLAWSAATIELPTLWNPSILPLPLAAFTVCAMAFAARGELLDAVGAGLALGFSIDAHVVSTALVPVFAVAVVAAAARPAIALPLALASLVSALAASSSGALRSNGALFGALKLATAGGLGLASSIAIGAALRARLRAMTPEGRARALLGAVLGSFAITFAAVWATSGHPPAPRYGAPVVPAAAILAGGILYRVFAGEGALVPARFRARAGVVIGIAVPALVVGFMVLTGRRSKLGPQARAWTAEDVERIAPALYAEGRSYGDLFRHVRGPDAFALVTQLAAYGPPPGPARAPFRDDLLALKLPRDRAVAAREPGWTLVDLDARDVALVRRGHSWLDLANLEICIEPASAEPRCAHASLADDDPDRGAAGGFAQRAYPGIDALRRAFAPADLARLAPFRWTVAAQIHTGPDEPPHELWMVDPAVAWEVVEVAGVQSAAPLPAKRVRLLRSEDGHGRIVFAARVEAGDAGRFVPWLPDMIETEDGEDALRGLAAEVLP